MEAVVKTHQRVVVETVKDLDLFLPDGRLRANAYHRVELLVHRHRSISRPPLPRNLTHMFFSELSREEWDMKGGKEDVQGERSTNGIMAAAPMRPYYSDAHATRDARYVNCTILLPNWWHSCSSCSKQLIYGWNRSPRTCCHLFVARSTLTFR